MRAAGWVKPGFQPGAALPLMIACSGAVGRHQAVRIATMAKCGLL